MSLRRELEVSPVRQRQQRLHNVRQRPGGPRASSTPPPRSAELWEGMQARQAEVQAKSSLARCSLSVVKNPPTGTTTADLPTRKPSASGASARTVEVGGSGGIPGGRLRRPEARPEAGERDCGGGGGRGVAHYILHLRESTPPSVANHSERRLAGGSL